MRPASQPTGASGLPSPGPRSSPPRPPEAAGLAGRGVSDDPAVCPCAPPGPRRSLAEPGAPRVDGRARLPLCFAEARVTLDGSSDPWGLALRRHGGDRGGAAAGSGTGDIAGRPGGRAELKLEAPGLCARPYRSPGVWAPWRLLASSLPTPGCRPRLIFVRLDSQEQ